MALEMFRVMDGLTTRLTRLQQVLTCLCAIEPWHRRPWPLRKFLTCALVVITGNYDHSYGYVIMDARSTSDHVIFCRCFFYSFLFVFLWPPKLAKRLIGSSRNFHTW